MIDAHQDRFSGWVVTLGNIERGFSFFGPFKTEQEALNWGEGNDVLPIFNPYFTEMSLDELFDAPSEKE